MDAFLRRATPIVLLVLASLAWFGPWIPGYDGLASRFGEGAVLRFVVGLLCLYTLMGVLERQRMEVHFKQVLGAFREFSQKRGETGGVDAQKEAVAILLGALSSADAEVRSNAIQHLKRLTGQDLGEDPTAWQAWWRTQGQSDGSD